MMWSDREVAVSTHTPGLVTTLPEQSDDNPRTKWGVGKSGSMFWSTHDVVNNITPGLYSCTYVDGIGPVLQKMPTVTDSTVILTDENTFKVVEIIKHFWTPSVRKSFVDMGFLYKRGIMMYGDPGSGKTTAIHTIIQEIVKMGGLAIYPNNGVSNFRDCINMIRSIERDIPVVAILEDFDTAMEDSYAQNQWLSILDGEAQTDNIVFLATTNYIDRIDKRFIDRPSRFDVIQPVPMPSAISRALYLYHKDTQLSIEDIVSWVEQTKGFSIAHLKEIIVSVRCYSNTFEDTIQRLKLMQTRSFSMDDLNGSEEDEFGFLARPKSNEHFDLVEFKRLVTELEKSKRDQ